MALGHLEGVQILQLFSREVKLNDFLYRYFKY